MTPILAITAGLLVLPLLWVALRLPATRRIATRNIARRRGEALLVTGGAMLATAIIAASLVVGDVVDGSIRSGAENFLGPIDVRVQTADTSALPAMADATLGADHPDVDGVLPWIDTTGSLVAGDRGVAQVPIAEVDLAAARAFGGDATATGLAGTTALASGEALLAADVAADLVVGAGDRVTVHAFGRSTDLVVADVLPARGLVGYGRVLTPPGTLTGLAGGPSAPGLSGELLVSTTGGVADAVPVSEETMAALRTLVGAVGEESEAPGAAVDAVKARLLADADQAGAEFTGLFSSIGSFGVIAGVLLLVNLFVMLAEERRRDLGTLRALGMRRGLLARTFALEGAVYAGAAATLGAVLGAGLGLAVGWVTSTVFGITGQGLTFRPVLEPDSLLTAGLLGFVIALATAWVLSLRIAKANVVRSLRDLPEPPRPHVTRTLVLAVLGVAGGAALTVLGVGSEVPEATLAGVPMGAVAAVALARRVVPVKVAMAAAGTIAVAWALVATQLWADAFAAAEMTVFVVQGVVLTAGAVTVLAAADGLWARAADAAVTRTGGVAVRLGTAYPLARRFRTSMLLGSFALVVFTITFIAALDGVFKAQGDTFVADSAGGFHLVVETPASAVGAGDALAGRGDVAAVASLDRRFAAFRAADATDEVHWPITGFDERLVAGGAPRLTARDDAYADDAAVYAAVLADPSLVIVSDGFLNGGGPGGRSPGVGDTVTALESATGSGRELRIVGVLAGDLLWHGGFVAPDVAGTIGRPGEIQRFLVALTGDADPASVATAVDADLVTLGADAGTFTERVAEMTAEQSSFLRLMQVFLGLGLVIGIAGLGVVLVRAVRERTRQVGMLRAMGVRRATVGRAFLIEAGFVAVQGVVVGAVLGLVSAWQVLTRTDTFGQADIAFTIPWVSLAVIVVVPLVAAVATTLQPARQAAAIEPAAALRFAD
jgi:putative ABC transport system permease protein